VLNVDEIDYRPTMKISAMFYFSLLYERSNNLGHMQRRDEEIIV